jgi:hypothetical protein
MVSALRCAVEPTPRGRYSKQLEACWRDLLRQLRSDLGGKSGDDHLAGVDDRPSHVMLFQTVFSMREKLPRRAAACSRRLEIEFGRHRGFLPGRRRGLQRFGRAKGRQRV